MGAQPNILRASNGETRPNALEDVYGLSREVIDALPAALYMTDAEGRITFYNEAAAALWGCRPELGDSKFCASWKLYRPDGTPLPHDECPMAMALQEKRPIRGVEAVAERPDGTRVHFFPYPAPLFDANGRLTGAINMLVDISGRKRAEEALAEREAQLAVFVEHAPAAIAMFDRDMRYLAVSRRFVIDYHLPPGAQLLGQSHYDVFPNIPQRWRDIHARVLAGEELSQERDQYTRHDGRTDWVRWSMVPWCRANGNIGGALLFAEIITEEVEARRALAESEARFRATFENAAVGVVLVGPNGTILRANESFARMLGYSAQELRTKSFQDLTHPDDLEASLLLLKSGLAGKADSYCVEKRYVRRDGGIVWVNLNVGCVRKADSAVDYFISVIENITKRKEAEEKLRKSEQPIRELLSALPAAIFVTDALGRITYYNQAAVELWGRRPELGKDRWSDLARPCCADGKPARLADCPTEIALKHGKSVRGLETILERADGTRVPVVPYPTPLRDATGAIVGVVNMTVDISERQQAKRILAERNAQLALAGQAALVGSYVYDVNKGTMQISEGFATIHGLPDGTTETTISEWQSRVHPEDLARAEGLREQVFAERRKEDTAEYRIVLSTGELRWIERRGVISYGEDGRPNRVVGVNIDVTERKRAEQHQQALNAELDHRVKNVLATVSAIIAQTQEASNSRAEFVSGLNSRINSLSRTHELLSQSNWRGASLAEIIRRELAPYTRGNTEAEGPSVTLKAEATQAVATVLHELTTNAAKYGALSNLSGRVSVRWRWLQNRSDDRLVIEWQEIGGPLILAPSRSGYGTSIIRELIPFEFGGAVELSFATEGTKCRLEIPGEWAGRGPS
jgi:PAS domain S-box-containing protein